MPRYLRCEYRVDPWGVDAKDPWTQQQRPRLYWIVTSNRRAQKQTAFRVLVASSEANLNAGTGQHQLVNVFDTLGSRSGQGLL